MADSTYKVHLVSLGCPKNTVDSQRMLGLLQGNGYGLTADPTQADVVVVNTCAFIGPAKEESIEAVLAAHQLRATGRCRAVIVTGCLASRYQRELQQELPEADRILPIAREEEIAEQVDAVLGRGPRAGRVTAAPIPLTPKHWGYLRISDGCDQRCAFCTIPAIRGRHRSEPMDRLLEQARDMAAGGVRELVLVSQDSMRYGADLYGRPQLLPLLEKLATVEGIQWLRLMYTHPSFWTEAMMEFFASCPVMCAYIDMPLQHISDPVLRRMQRPTTRGKIQALLNDLRQRLPQAGLRSTFIVGYPGETEAQFEELLEFVERTRFDHVSAFIYSAEEGTAAWGLDGEVDEETKEERYARLTQVQEGVSATINEQLVGSTHRVLVDSIDADNDVSYARMERDAPEIDGQVVIAGQAPAVGCFVEVEMTAGYAYERHARIAPPLMEGVQGKR